MINCCFTKGTGRFLRNRVWVPVGEQVRNCYFTKGTGRFLWNQVQVLVGAQMKNCCFTKGTGRFLRNRAWVLVGSHMRTCCFTEGTGGFLRNRAWVPVGSHMRTCCSTKGTGIYSIHFVAILEQALSWKTLSLTSCLALLRVMSFAPGNTLAGELSPWEVAKAFAFHKVLQKAAEVLDTPAAELVGQRVDEFIAKQLTLTGGGNIDDDCVEGRPVGLSLTQKGVSKMVFLGGS